MQEPVAVFDRLSPLYKIGGLSQESTVDDTLNDLDYELSDLEGELGILESNVENCVNVTNYDDFDKLLFKKRVD